MRFDVARFCLRRNRGFTLVEIIFVLVILGIVATIGSSFVVSAVDSYRTAELRNKLVQRGRLALEQMSRELRTSVPNSVRVSASGRCVEFIPTVATAQYKGSLPTSGNSAAEKSTVQTVDFVLGFGSPQHVVIAPHNSGEIYVSANPGARIGLGTLGTEPYSSVPLSSNHRFLRESITRRLYLGANPVRFCVSSDLLQRFDNYGLDTGALTDAPPSGNLALMATGVEPNTIAFSLSPGSEDRNADVAINLLFNAGTTSIDLHQQVFIRNVP